LIEFNKEGTFKLLRGSLGEPRLCEQEENAVEELERREATAALSLIMLRPHYLRCPSLIPSFNAFCRNDPSVLFVSFTILANGVFAFE
jgi:hypothetical protein